MLPITRLLLYGILFGINWHIAPTAAQENPNVASLEESMAKMSVPEGFVLEVVATEPMVRQPVAIDFDDRGRLWVIQYLQYPNPNGLKRVTVDRYSRTKYDRVPEPPPHGPIGDDRITILEDLDGDGHMDREHDFVAGLNLATGMAFGHGGVFVLNVPYLLFYPDRNRDDVPDTDPEVLLNGFGMEDAHSVANSLTFGPDGWLYGCQGSTVTANIRGIEFQQGVWRYHPSTREFELFCEGGGNSWGLDFDRSGRLLYSTNYGGHTLLHGVQGGYFVKSFGKHGALHNPHAYGYFEHAPHQNFRGGHVTVGGIVYQGDAFPASLRGKYIAGDLLGHGVNWHSIHPHGSTVMTSHGGELLVSDDSWFAPTDVTLGPDGAIYVSDWRDQRTAHPDPDADWDRSNGRIYRIAAARTKRSNALDMTKLNAEELFKLHQHQSQWFVRKARQEIVRRYSQESLDERVRVDANWLREKFRESATTAADETAALEGLWSLNLLGGFNEILATDLLHSPHPAVRSWTVRLLGDARIVSDEMAHRLDQLAEQESDVNVRQQLACSAARFPSHQALPIINANINRDIDADDPYVPLLWWWAIEKHSFSGREEVLKRFVRPTLWKSRLGRNLLLTRLIRRYSSERTGEGLDSVVRLLKAAPDQQARQELWPHVWLGWQEQTSKAPMNEWLEIARKHKFSQWLLSDWTSQPDDLTLLRMGCVMRHDKPFAAAKQTAFNPTAPIEQRAAMLGILSTVTDQALLAPALEVLATDPSEAVRVAALQIVARYDEPALTKELIRLQQTSTSSRLQSQILDVILSRTSTASLWLQSVDQGEISTASISIEQIHQLALLEDPKIDAMVAKHWGRVQSATPEEKLAEVRRLNNDLRAAEGDPKSGHLLFKKHCAACHQLFGEGTNVGPDLTTANRQDRDFLLISLVDPNSIIRKEYVSVIIQTTSGRILTGLPIERTDASLTLVNEKGEKQAIASSEIEELTDSTASLMPEDLYRQLTPTELRDLFAFLQSKQ
jgi:putative membrane-bound dehydrogenase-like protein